MNGDRTDSIVSTRTAEQAQRMQRLLTAVERNDERSDWQRLAMPEYTAMKAARALTVLEAGQLFRNIAKRF